MTSTPSTPSDDTPAGSDASASAPAGGGTPDAPAPAPTSARANLGTVDVPAAFAEPFARAKEFVAKYFDDRHFEPTRGTITIAGERYILVRAASMSVEFSDLVASLYAERGESEARAVADNLLFDVAHALGKADALAFHDKLGVTETIDRLSAGPIHFAHAGWAFVRIEEESIPAPNDEFFLRYEHPFSFEADAWIRQGRTSPKPVCVMNSGYSSGWCEESFGIPLVAAETECRACGADACRFIMAPPSQIERHLASITRERADVAGNHSRTAAVPEFFQRKRMEDALREANDDLERRVAERTIELARANTALEEQLAVRERLQAQLVLSQKLEGLGRLAGGIAHDFNNLLTIVLGHATALKDGIAADADDQIDVDGIIRAAQRATSLTRQLLTFARRQAVEAEVVELDHNVQTLREMVPRLLGEQVELRVELSAPGICVRIDPGQFEQVVLNLAVNARDAMPGGGVLEIRTRTRDVLSAVDGSHDEVPPGRYFELSVRDHGEGMDAETQQRIFEPFFSTKPLGIGAGLGLATSYGIVRQAGGFIAVESALGHGTQFSVLFPIAESAQTAHSGASDVSEAATARRTACVLVVEDEREVLELATRILARAGYRVLSARDPRRAVELVRSSDDPIDLLLSDVVMPGMNGADLARALREDRPGLPVLLVSGYSDDILEGDRMPEGAVLMPKPYTPPELLAKVRAVLDASR